jgi:hypothetical protein
MSTPFDPYRPPQASLDEPPPLDPASTVPPALIQLMAQTRPWVRLLSVLTFIGVGVTVPTGIYMISMNGQLVPGAASVAATIFLVALMCLSIPPPIFLWQYASGIRRLQDGGGMASLEEALTRQKSYWKYLGILVSIVVGFYLLIFLGGLMLRTTLRH